MKHCRGWVVLLAVLLTGCGATDAPVTDTEETAGALAAEAAAVYDAISEYKNFTVTVEERDGALTVLHITPDNAWNVENPAWGLENSFTWSAAEERDWDGQLAEEDRGNLLTLVSAGGQASLRCCSGGDVVELTADGETRYARAVNPKEGQEPFEGKVYDLMVVIARDAMSALVWSGAVDGGLDMDAAAARLAEQVAEAYRNVPDWVEWKPADFQLSSVSVFDAYRGKPENFCCGMGFRLLVEDPDSAQAGYWQAGSGLGEPDGDGYYYWGSEVTVQKNGAGDWYCADRGTGGASVLLPFGWAWTEGVPLEDLVDAFFLTEGFTHDWLLAKYIVAQPSEALAELPELLAGRTEAELQNFGATLAALYRDYPSEENWASQEDLRTALGPYAVYLDA